MVKRGRKPQNGGEATIEKYGTPEEASAGMLLWHHNST
jgi:hypothetical protein